MRQAQLQEIQARHNAGQGPAAFVDTRTLNGQNNRKPKDKNLRVTPYGGNYQKGGGSSSGPEQGFAVMPAAPAEPDVPPMAPPSFNDILGQIKGTADWHQQPSSGPHASKGSHPSQTVSIQGPRDGGTGECARGAV